mmetsp:Transcript_107760/g.170134  ORF Transcript_107760/g.170134 Transcript_107760/m.170134 type:complete len:632 (+) Transcript_107760:104-1999(+)
MPLYEEKLISPLAIRFTQQRIRETFRDGRPVEPTIQEIGILPGVAEYDVILDAPFPTIEVIRWAPFGRKSGAGEHWFSFDNRRLYCLQRLATALWPKHVAAKVEVLYFDPGAIRKKLDSLTVGQSVTIGHAFAVGDELREWSWRDAVQAHTPPGYFANAIELSIAADDAKTSVHELKDVPARERVLVPNVSEIQVLDPMPQSATDDAVVRKSISADSPEEEPKDSLATEESLFERGTFASLIGQLIDIKIGEFSQTTEPSGDGVITSESSHVAEQKSMISTEGPCIETNDVNVDESQAQPEIMEHVEDPQVGGLEDSAEESEAKHDIQRTQQDDIDEHRELSPEDAPSREELSLSTLIGQLLTLTKEDHSLSCSPISDDTNSTRLSEPAVASSSEEEALESAVVASGDEGASIDEALKEEHFTTDSVSPERKRPDPGGTVVDKAKLQGTVLEEKSSEGESGPSLENPSLTSLIGQLLSLGRSDGAQFPEVSCEDTVLANSTHLEVSANIEESIALADLSTAPAASLNNEVVAPCEERLEVEPSVSNEVVVDEVVVEDEDEEVDDRSLENQPVVGELLQRSCSLHAARAAQRQKAQYEMARWQMAQAERMAQWQQAMYGYPTQFPTEHGAFW